MTSGKDPETPEEWQEAVNAAQFALLIDSAMQYGLIKMQGARGRPRTKTSRVNVERAETILMQGKALGILPEQLE